MKKAIATAVLITGLSAIVFACAEATPTGTPEVSPGGGYTYEEVPPMGPNLGPAREESPVAQEQIAAMSMNRTLSSGSTFQRATEEEIAALSMNPPVAAAGPADNGTGVESPWEPTEAQKLAIAEALAERDRILAGD